MFKSSAVAKFDPLLFTDGIPLVTKSDLIAECIAPFLDWHTLVQCSLVSRHFNEACNKRIWRKPEFHEGYLHDSLYLFNRFIDLLPRLRPETRALIAQLDLSDIEETLYDNVRPHFFEYIVRYVSNLQILKLRRTSFFSVKSLGPLLRQHWSLPYLCVLDLSFCDHVTDDLLVALAPAMPRLEYLRLDSLGSSAGGERGLAAFADHAQLVSFSIRNNATITDGALMAVAKFGKLNVKEIDITGCHNVTNAGLQTVARYNINLQFLSLADTQCSSETACAFLTGRSARYLRHLDIGFCRNVDRDATRIARCFKQGPTELKRLAISMTVAQAIIHELDGQASPAPVEYLVIHHIPEGTHLRFLTLIATVFPSLKHLTLTRDYYEYDFISFGSRDAAEDSVTEDTLKKFNLQQNKIVVTMANMRDTIDGLTIHFW